MHLHNDSSQLESSKVSSEIPRYSNSFPAVHLFREIR